MTATGTLQILPIWVWLLFAILLVGVIVFFYTHGNWRITFSFTALTIAIILAIAGVNAWFLYLQTHFMGQFDRLGIPFRTAGPGWDILVDAWPLWLVPMFLMAAVLILIDWGIRHFFPTKIIAPTAELSEKEAEVIHPVQNISLKLELKTLKQELSLTQERLAETIELAETQLDKKQYLEARLEQTKEDYSKHIADLEDRIAALTAEIQSFEITKEELTSISLQQSEEIHELKTKLKS